MVQNKQFIFADYPDGLPKPGKDLTVESTEFDVEQQPPQGGFTAKGEHVQLKRNNYGRVKVLILCSPLCLFRSISAWPHEEARR